MAVELLNAYVSLSVETKQIPAQVNAALGQASRGAGKHGAAMGAAMGAGASKTLGSSMKSGLKNAAGLVGVTGGLAAVAGAFKGVVTAGMDFTNAMNTMKAVSGANSAQMDSVSQAARRLGNAVDLPATSANDAALAMVELAKGGFNVQQSMDAAKGTLQLAAAAQIDAATAATIQSNALQAFGKEASFAGKASDILAGAANASSAEITDVAQALSQTGTVANGYGISMQDTATAIAMFANAGIKGSDAGTMLKTSLVHLSTPSKKAAAAMDDLGIKAFDAQGKFVGLPTLFGQLNSASKRMTTEQYKAAAALVFGTDGIRLADVAAQQGRESFDKLSEAVGRNGNAAETAAAKTKGLPGAWERVKNSVEEVGLKIYDAVKGPLESALDGVSGFIDGLNNIGENETLKSFLDGTKAAFSSIGDSLKDIWPALKTFGEILGKAAAGVGLGIWTAFNGALGAIAGALKIAAPLLNALGDAASAAKTPITLLVGAFLAFKTATAITSRLRDGIAAVGTTATANMSRATSFTGAIQRMGYAYGNVAKGAGTARDALKRTATATGGVTQMAGYGTIGMGRFASSINELGKTTPVIGRMQTSFYDAAGGAKRFGKTAGIAAATGTAMRSGFGAATGGAGMLAGALGGPVGIGLTAALVIGGAALSDYQKRQAEAKAKADEHKASVDALAESVNAYTGALDENGKKQLAKEFNTDDPESGVSQFDVLHYNQNRGLRVSEADFTNAAAGDQGALDHVNTQLDSQVRSEMSKSGSLSSIAGSTGMSEDEVVAAVRGADGAVKKFQSRTSMDLGALRNDLTEAGRNAVTLGEALGGARDRTREAADQARTYDQAMGGVAARMPAIAAALNGIKQGQTISIDTHQIQGAEAMISSLGFKVQAMPDGTTKVTALTAEADGRLQALRSNLGMMNLMKVNPKVGLDGQTFNNGFSRAMNDLRHLDQTNAIPNAGLMIDQLLQGKAVSMNELQVLANTTADPHAKLEIEKIMANIDTVNRALDLAARARTANIEVRSYMAQASYIDRIAANAEDIPGFADGGIRKYADGGIQSFASGGASIKKLPKQAMVQRADPNGGLVQWAEPETGGEAFIPLAGSKRGRSEAILAKVADIFGMALVDKQSMSGVAGGVTSRLVGTLIKGTGIDAYANGGLREFVDGKGASQPLTGAPYVWGGVNWGDCSGAMSAIARFAVGLDPFAGRFATGDEGAQLAAMGFSPGRGGDGDLRFGWYNGGPQGGHTAGTLPDGTNVEMGGGNGGGMVGGAAAGSDSPQFTDHAFLKVGPWFEWANAGEDPGGYTPGQRGNEMAGNGDYGAGSGSLSGGSGGGGAGSEPTTLSGRLGNAAGAFVEGQLADLFSVLSINDSPGILGAMSEYEKAQQEKRNQEKQGEAEGKAQKINPADKAAAKKAYEDAKLEAKKEYEDEKLKRKKGYDAEKSKLKAELDSKKLDKSAYDTKAAELKKKYDETELAKKREYDTKTLEAKQKYDDLQRSQKSVGDDPSKYQPPSDPGMTKPKEGEDLGGGGGNAPAVPAGPESPQDAVKRAFRPKQWDVGEQWASTDYIVGKESEWNPTARNESSGAFGLFQFLGTTKDEYLPDENPDPFVQGEAGSRYIADRYGDPSKAKAFWEANGWYDKGGIAEGAGFMAKGTLKPERILDPRQTKAFDKMVERNFETVPASNDEGRRREVRPQVTYNIHAGNTERAFNEAQRLEKKRAASGLRHI